MAIFGPKAWVNPFGKMSIFRLFERLFLQPRKLFFRCRISYETFSWPILPKKKLNMLEKRPFFFQNHGFTPLEKYQFFDFLNLLFYSLKRCFFVLEYRKRRFPGLQCLKKKLEKWPFLDQNHELTPLKKCQFFDFFVLLFFVSLERRFFVLEYRKGQFPMLYCRQKKRRKNGTFWSKTMG